MINYRLVEEEWSCGDLGLLKSGINNFEVVADLDACHQQCKNEFQNGGLGC